MPHPLPESLRKEIFSRLVDAQDHEMPVAKSRQAIALQFSISEQDLRDIEREGIDNDWPPLNT